MVMKMQTSSPPDIRRVLFWPHTFVLEFPGLPLEVIVMQKDTEAADLFLEPYII